ncbi:MAG: class I SAM-dependent methyltransferase [Candidatus Sumerlaeia bacterium]|nr:class I SAM-dependent methyltransferase [Candidatus Sumerlaeia bacterium]
MEESEYKKMYALENSYWWFQGRKHIIFSVLNRLNLLKADATQRAIDLGCGTGLILTELNNFAFSLGVDFSMSALCFCRKRGLKDLICADVNYLPFTDSCCDLVFALDLLEHISDDEKVLQEIWRICRPGGMLLLTVPAHQFLWSEHDEALHHYRRYSMSQFYQLIVKSGFIPVKFSYCISFLFLPILIFRRLQKIIKSPAKPKTHLIILPKLINSFLIWLLKLEAKLIRFINLPFGVSILVVAQKTGSEPDCNQSK